jgi:hypothetical protein
MTYLHLKRTGLALGACLVVALLVAACGGGDDDAKPTTAATSNATADGTTNATTAATDEPVDTADNSGGDTTDPVDNGTGSPCSLITTDQVSAATGSAMKDGVGLGSVNDAYSNCSWERIDAQTGTAILSLDFFKQGAATNYTDATGEGDTDVPGIGEKARWSDLLSTLEFVQGDDYFAIYVHTASNENNQAAATTIAAIVLQSLS